MKSFLSVLIKKTFYQILKSIQSIDNFSHSKQFKVKLNFYLHFIL
jgi:hypothetical protein